MRYLHYQIKQKTWSFVPTYDISDEHGQVIFKVNTPGIQIFKKLKMLDMRGREVLNIHQKPWAWPPKYEVREGMRVVAEVHRQFAFLQYKIDYFVGQDTDISIIGEVFRREFEFQREGQVIASVSKKRWGWNDQYGMSILETEDQELLLASAIVIDLMLFNNKKRS